MNKNFYKIIRLRINVALLNVIFLTIYDLLLLLDIRGESHAAFLSRTPILVVPRSLFDLWLLSNALILQVWSFKTRRAPSCALDKDFEKFYIEYNNLPNLIFR